MIESDAILWGKRCKGLHGKCTVCGAIVRDGGRPFDHMHYGHPASSYDAVGYPKEPSAEAPFGDPSRFRCDCGRGVTLGAPGELTHETPACPAFLRPSYVVDVFGDAAKEVLFDAARSS